MTQTIHACRRRAAVALMTCGLLSGARVAAADTLTLMWDFNTEPEVAGYFVYVGTQSGVYSQTIDVQNVNMYAYTSASPGQQYCFAVAAYAGSIVSPLSAEVCGFSNRYPSLANPGNQTTRAGQAVTLTLTGVDPDGMPLTFSATGLPPGLAVSGAGVIAGVPTTVGTYNVVARATDGVLTSQQPFSWVIQSAQVNIAPTLANPGPMTSNVGQQVLLQLQAADADGDPLTYSASNLPPGLQIASSTGRITGTPTTAAQHFVTATVSDGRTSTSQAFTWTIRTTSQNQAPVLAAPGSQASTVGLPAQLQLAASDPNGDALTYSASGLPPGLQITAGTGRIAGTPTAAGTYSVSATVTDGLLSAQQSFTWTVSSTGAPPTPPTPPVPPTPPTPTPPTPTSPTGSEAVARSTATQAAPASYTGSVATARPSAAPAPGQARDTRAATGTAAIARNGVTTAPVTATQGAYTGTAALVRSTASAAGAAQAAGSYTGTAAMARTPGQENRSGALATGSGSTTRAIAGDPSPAATAAMIDVAAPRGASDDEASRPLGSLETGEPRRTMVTAPAAAPTVTIETPVDRATIAPGTPVIFSAVAHDALDGDLTARIVWTSSRDGRIGTGGLLHRELRPGTHVITASVTDGDGHSRRAQVTVIVAQR